MKSFLRGVSLFAIGLVGTSATGSGDYRPASDYRNDPRLARLKQFFSRNRCPIENLAADFLYAADLYNLDWTLLPSISLVESGGGRAAAKNNLFGWDSGKKGFRSLREAIHTVASRLAFSKLYRDKDLRSILLTYNPNPAYAARVQSIMQRLSRTELPPDHPSNNRMAK